MIDEVKGSNLSTLSGLANQHKLDQAKEHANATGNKTQGTAEDSVSLTDQAEKLRALEAKVNDQPVVDTKRVEALRSAILDGTYTVDAERTAKKMADFENLLDSKAGDK